MSVEVGDEESGGETGRVSCHTHARPAHPFSIIICLRHLLCIKDALANLCPSVPTAPAAEMNLTLSQEMASPLLSFPGKFN